MSKTLIVNHLPVPTMNKLRMNQSGMQVPEQVSVLAADAVIPEGITLERMDAETAQKWLQEKVPVSEREKYVAGKAPIYQEQNLPTGMGKDIDDYLIASEAEVDVYHIEKNTKAASPVIWDKVLKDGENALSAQIIVAEEGSESTFIMTYESEKEETGFYGISTRIILEKNAVVHVVKAQMLGSKVLHFDDIGTMQYENSRFEMLQLELGGDKVYTGNASQLNGDRSSNHIELGYLGRGKQTLDMNYTAVQRGLKTDSALITNGVLLDETEKTFRGTIDFRCGAKGSTGVEDEKVLLLSSKVVNKTIPLILCEEEDVEGAHGATIGRLSEDLLFYLMSRGLDREQAEQMIITGRLLQTCNQIPDEKVREKISNYIEEAFS